ncbi:hypothetical protein ABZ990_08435 [Streptomyces sp. NPDC046203]|uniref:hypothetical protein n=1 Tax=Streptomyces sp. NPDC046203 TaxID=3154602 RepID=UPI0033C06B89
MRMYVAPHLLTEDRLAFEQTLDDVLHALAGAEVPGRDVPGPAGAARPTVAQLRARALEAVEPITTTAATEYDHFIRVREQARARTRAGEQAHEQAGEQARSVHGGGDTAMRPAHARGTELVTALTVLAPLLAGTAATILLLAGAVLRLVEPAPAFADTLLTTGLYFGAGAAAGLLCGAMALVITALRNGTAQAGNPAATPTPTPTPTAATTTTTTADDETARAEEAWRRALRDRGIVPFLRDARALPPIPDEHRGNPEAQEDPVHPAPGTGRLPRSASSAPDFTGPDFTRPGFTGPDLGAPGHDPG